MIIGIVGYIGSGKGTVGNILVNDFGYYQFAFADALKDATAAIFMWPRGLLEGDSEASRKWREQVDPWWSERFGYEVTPRLILQKMGTEACRHGISDNIWITALEKRIAGYEDVVISDVRFPNEIDFVRSAGGIIVRVKRGEDPSIEERAKMHISETAWNDTVPDVTIENEGTIDDLREKLKSILTLQDKPRTIMHHPV